MATEEKKDSPAKKALGGKSKKKSKKGKRVHMMHLRHAANGGYVAQHDFQPTAEGMPQPSEEHVVAGGPEELAAHVQQHMAEPPGQEQQAEPQGV